MRVGLRYLRQSWLSVHVSISATPTTHADHGVSQSAEGRANARVVEGRANASMSQNSLSGHSDICHQCLVCLDYSLEVLPGCKG